MGPLTHEDPGVDHAEGLLRPTPLVRGAACRGVVAERWGAARGGGGTGSVESRPEEAGKGGRQRSPGEGGTERQRDGAFGESHPSFHPLYLTSRRGVRRTHRSGAGTMLPSPVPSPPPRLPVRRNRGGGVGGFEDASWRRSMSSAARLRGVGRGARQGAESGVRGCRGVGRGAWSEMARAPELPPLWCEQAPSGGTTEACEISS